MPRSLAQITNSKSSVLQVVTSPTQRPGPSSFDLTPNLPPTKPPRQFEDVRNRSLRDPESSAPSLTMNSVAFEHLLSGHARDLREQAQGYVAATKANNDSSPQQLQAVTMTLTSLVTGVTNTMLQTVDRVTTSLKEHNETSQQFMLRCLDSVQDNNRKRRKRPS